MTERRLWVKSWILPQIESGRKSLEVRMPSRYMDSIEVGDTLVFNEKVRRYVKAVRKHRNIEELLLQENSFKILPGHDYALLQDRFAQMWEPGRDRKGVLVFEMEPV